MESNRFNFDKNLDIEAEVEESSEEVTQRQCELQDYAQNDGVVLFSPSLEPALAEDLVEDS